MNETQANRLLDRLADTVSVPPAPLADLLRQGHRARRRTTTRAVVAVAAAVAVAAGGSAYVAASVGGGPDTHAVAARDVRRALADYDPARMPQLLLGRSRAAFETAYPDLPDGVFTALDGMSDPLPPDLYDKADWMSVDYRATANQALSVRVGHQVDPSGDALEDECARQVGVGRSAACDVVTVDGEPAKDSVSLVTWVGDGPRPYENLPGQKGHPTSHLIAELPALDPDTVWWEHTVELVHPGGYLTIVTESVRATSLAAARRLFGVDTDTMAGLADDPDLVVPRPPTAGPGCPSWTIKDHGQVCTTTAADTATARRILGVEVERTGAVLAGATLGVSAGTVADPDPGATRCSSGRLLHLTLVGTFVGTFAGASGATVQSLVVTADAVSGEVCTARLKPGRVPLEPYSAPLPTS